MMKLSHFILVLSVFLFGNQAAFSEDKSTKRSKPVQGPTQSYPPPPGAPSGPIDWSADFDPQKHGKLCDEEPYSQSNACQNYLAAKEGKMPGSVASVPTTSSGGGIDNTVGEGDGDDVGVNVWNEKRQPGKPAIQGTSEEEIVTAQGAQADETGVSAEKSKELAIKQEVSSVGQDCRENTFGTCAAK